LNRGLTQPSPKERALKASRKSSPKGEDLRKERGGFPPSPLERAGVRRNVLNKNANERR